MTSTPRDRPFLELPPGAQLLLARELRRLSRILDRDERVVAFAQGRREDATGLVAVTNRRVLFVGRMLVVTERSFRAQVEEYPLPEIGKVTAAERRLSDRLELRVGRRRVVFDDVLPRGRAAVCALLIVPPKAVRGRSRTAPTPVPVAA